MICRILIYIIIFYLFYTYLDLKQISNKIENIGTDIDKIIGTDYIMNDTQYKININNNDINKVDINNINE